MLAVAGWADVISAIFRTTILQMAAPDRLRGRLFGIHILVVTGGPRLGDVEAGLVARPRVAHVQRRLRRHRLLGRRSDSSRSRTRSSAGLAPPSPPDVRCDAWRSSRMRSSRQFLSNTEGWTSRGDAIHKDFTFPGFRAAIAFVNRVAERADAARSPSRHRDPLQPRHDLALDARCRWRDREGHLTCRRDRRSRRKRRGRTRRLVTRGGAGPDRRAARARGPEPVLPPSRRQAHARRRGLAPRRRREGDRDRSRDRDPVDRSRCPRERAARPSDRARGGAADETDRRALPAPDGSGSEGGPGPSSDR